MDQKITRVKDRRFNKWIGFGLDPMGNTRREIGSRAFMAVAGERGIWG